MLERWRPFLAGVVALALVTSSLQAQTDERKAFIGITIGPSIPFGTFANTTNEPGGGGARTGYNDSFLNLGKQVGTHWGWAGSVFYNEHNMKAQGGDDWWQVAGVTAGPMYSTSLSRRAIVDLKLKVGFLTTMPIIDAYETARGRGFATDARVSLRYNVLRRWCLLTEAGVVVSNQSFEDETRQGFRAFVSGFGVAYRPSW